MRGCGCEALCCIIAHLSFAVWLAPDDDADAKNAKYVSYLEFERRKRYLSHHRKDRVDKRDGDANNTNN